MLILFISCHQIPLTRPHLHPVHSNLHLLLTPKHSNTGDRAQKRAERDGTAKFIMDVSSTDTEVPNPNPNPDPNPNPNPDPNPDPNPNPNPNPNPSPDPNPNPNPA